MKIKMSCFATMFAVCSWGTNAMEPLVQKVGRVIPSMRQCRTSLTHFESPLKPLFKYDIPTSSIRVNMMPIIIGDMNSLPVDLDEYKELLRRLFDYVTREFKGGLDGQVGYITIDNLQFSKNKTQRRPGLHVDGFGKSDGWGGGSSHGSGNPYVLSQEQRSGIYKNGPGMIIGSTSFGCLVYKQSFKGCPGENGECDHLADQLDPNAQVYLNPNHFYWLGPLTVHRALTPEEGYSYEGESIVPDVVNRTITRLSLPSGNAPWFVGYTANPLGIKPSGPILDGREAFINYSKE